METLLNQALPREIHRQQNLEVWVERGYPYELIHDLNLKKAKIFHLL